jgi:hypothetical protein
MTERYEIAYRELDGDVIAYGIADKENGTIWRCMEDGFNAYDSDPEKYAEALAELKASVAVRNADYAELVALRKEVLGN